LQAPRLPRATGSVSDVSRELTAGCIDPVTARLARRHRDAGTLQNFRESADAFGRRTTKGRVSKGINGIG